MRIHISDEAASWFEDEMVLNEGDFIRFFARYGGCSTVQQGFSLGISKEEPVNPGTEITKNGITYYIEEKDIWYFDQHDLHVEYNDKAREPEYKYI